MGVGIRSRKASGKRLTDYRERLQRTAADTSQYRAIRSACRASGSAIGFKLADGIACDHALVTGAHYHGGQLSDVQGATEGSKGQRRTVTDGQQARETALLAAEAAFGNGQ